MDSKLSPLGPPPPQLIGVPTLAAISYPNPITKISVLELLVQDALPKFFSVVGAPFVDDGILFPVDFVGAVIYGARAANWSECDKADQHQPHQGPPHSFT